MRIVRLLPALLAVASPACVLDFDKFLDGSLASDASRDGGFVDGTSASACQLVVGVAHPSNANYAGSLVRFELRTDGSYRRCSDVTRNVPSQMRGIAAFSANRFGIAAGDDSWLLDISSNATPVPIQNYAGYESVDAFALNVDGTDVLGVTYRASSAAAGTVQRVRFFDAVRGYDHGIGLWDITGLPAGSTPTGVASHPGFSPVSTKKMVVVLREAGRSVYEAEPLVSGRVASFWGGAPGVSMVSVRSLANHGAAMIGSNGGRTAVYLTNNDTSSSAVAGPFTCPDYCDSYRYAMRDPTSDALVMAVCERSTTVRLVRWAVPSGSCSELMSHNISASDQIAGITIIP